MSEYQSPDALTKLMGTFDNEAPGSLLTLLKANPYGVFLLDEFEKTHVSVRNFLLQLFKYGVVTDTTGSKISCRDIIFIASSSTIDPKDYAVLEKIRLTTDTRVPELPGGPIFNTELIKAFDDLIVFEPLSKEDTLNIANRMFNKVARRLLEKNITLNLTGEILDYLVRHGYNNSFGARPMSRLLQNTIEQSIADLLIRGKLSSGQTLEFKVIGDTGFKEDLQTIVKS